MAGGWDSNGYDLPVSGVDDADTFMAKVVDGIAAALSCYFGAADPSSGASWGADQVGRRWRKEGADAYNHVEYVWTRFDAGGTDFGWKANEGRGELWDDDAPATVTLPSPGTPFTTSSSGTLDLSAEIAALQGTTFDNVDPAEVSLEVTVTEAGTVGAANAYVTFGKPGASSMARKVKAQVSGIPVVQEIRVPCSTSGTLDLVWVVGTGSPSLAVVVKLLAVHERCAP